MTPVLLLALSMTALHAACRLWGALATHDGTCPELMLTAALTVPT